VKGYQINEVCPSKI